MVKRPIEIRAGSLPPTETPAWARAAAKLEEARSGIALMTSANDREAYEVGWGRVVDSLEEFWSTGCFSSQRVECTRSMASRARHARG
jgi:hypothetical protein